MLIFNHDHRHYHYYNYQFYHHNLHYHHHHPSPPHHHYHPQFKDINKILHKNLYTCDSDDYFKGIKYNNSPVKWVFSRHALP